MLLLEIKKLLLLLLPHQSDRWVNEIITTSAFRVDLEKSSAGSFKEPLLSSGWREKSCNVAARIMRWGGSPARALTSSDAIRDKDYA